MIIGIKRQIIRLKFFKVEKVSNPSPISYILMPDKNVRYMDTSKLNGGGDTGKITTLNENVDRVLIVTAEGKQQWMTPGDAATELQKKMATVTVSQAGLVNPVFGKFQTTSTGGVLLARIAKTGGAFSAKIYVSAPSLLGGELFLAVAVSSAGVVTSKLITKESGVGIDASLVASYVTSGDYVELYITRGGEIGRASCRERV